MWGEESMCRSLWSVSGCFEHLFELQLVSLERKSAVCLHAGGPRLRGRTCSRSVTCLGAWHEESTRCGGQTTHRRRGRHLRASVMRAQVELMKRPSAQRRARVTAEDGTTEEASGRVACFFSRSRVLGSPGLRLAACRESGFTARAELCGEGPGAPGTIHAGRLEAGSVDAFCWTHMRPSLLLRRECLKPCGKSPSVGLTTAAKDTFVFFFRLAHEKAFSSCLLQCAQRAQCA